MKNPELRLNAFVGRLMLMAVSDVYDGELGETEIIIEGGTLCGVSGDKRNEFIEKLQKLINEYSI